MKFVSPNRDLSFLQMLGLAKVLSPPITLHMVDFHLEIHILGANSHFSDHSALTGDIHTARDIMETQADFLTITSVFFPLCAT